ncbi:MAG TPA: carotenoid 1,2-hydratase [Proteobacteria bacterium]|nr:carotenoid 1,2-hydratase [Pseudomonadota bacterium]
MPRAYAGLIRRLLSALTTLLLGLTVAVPLTAWEKALSPYNFSFPEDHGSHPKYQTEWWYVTGRLTTPEDRHFGYQFTIFRQGITEQPNPAETNPWQLRDLYMLHCGLTDLEEKKFYAHQDISRAGPGLAGARENGMETWLKGSRIAWSEEKQALELRALTPDYELVLELKPTYPPILNGDRGLSAKGSRPGQASHYYSWPRLTGTGKLEMAGRSLAVHSLSWLDREFATNQLGPEQAGWDWFAFHFDDGSALMLYRMRLKKGGQDPTSSGTWIFADGRSHHLTAAEFSLIPGKTWRSPKSGAEYPLHWQIRLTEPRPLQLQIKALLADQEMQTDVTTQTNYWEGAVSVTGRDPVGRETNGHGYLEMTGYDRALGALQEPAR